MPLSDYEKRVLDQLEHSLDIDSNHRPSSPVSRLRRTGWRPRNRGTRSTHAAGLPTGLGLLLVALAMLLLGVHADTGSASSLVWRATWALSWRS
jgi:hypothetical protein